jgi:hypothetical protein
MGEYLHLHMHTQIYQQPPCRHTRNLRKRISHNVRKMPNFHDSLCRRQGLVTSLKATVCLGSECSITPTCLSLLVLSMLPRALLTSCSWLKTENSVACLGCEGRLTHIICCASWSGRILTGVRIPSWTRLDYLEIKRHV